MVEALLRQVRGSGWTAVDGMTWRSPRNLKVGAGGRGDALNVRRAHLHAWERGYDVLAFVRDRDGDEARHDDIDLALSALDESGERPKVIGGVAVETLESWLAAVAGATGSEDLRRPEEKLAELGIDEKDTIAMVKLVEERGIGGVPEDATSLRRWLDRARDMLGADRPT